MSKKRNRHHSLSSILNQSNTNQSLKPKPIFGANTTTSFYIPKSSILKDSQINFTDFKKQRVFNKNISFFRDNSGQGDPSLLHFMSSLRQNRTLEHDFTKTTELRPFTVASKRTMNQHTPKKIFEPTAKQSRISTAYYRWHNKSGKNTTNALQFECSLRDYNMNMNPEQQGFCTTVKPIKYQDVEPKFFDQSELFCPKQRKLFRMKAK